MIRYVLLLLLGLLAWVVFKRMSKPSANQTPSVPEQGTSTASPNDMVPCAHCGLHVPAVEAIQQPSADTPLYFCSTAHQKLGKAHASSDSSTGS